MTKKPTLLLCLSIIFALWGICPVSAQYPWSPDKTLIPLPTPPHKREIQLFFMGETTPAKGYIQLGYVTTRKQGHYQPNQLIEQLKGHAQRMGADGLLIWPPEKKMDFYADEETSYTSEVMDMTAMAIIFPENLTFIPGIVKTARVHGTDRISGQWVLLASQSFNFKGTPSDTIRGSKSTYNWWHNLTDQYLLKGNHAINSWDATRRLKSRRIPGPGGAMIVKIRYPNPRAKHPSRLRLLRNAKTYAIVRYHYEADNQTVKMREFRFENRDAILKEYPEHDADGRITGYRYTRTLDGKTEPYIQVSLDFYTQVEWDAAVAALVADKLVE